MKSRNIRHAAQTSLVTPGNASETQTGAPARASMGATSCLERDPGDSSGSVMNYAWLTPRRHYWLGDVLARNSYWTGDIDEVY